MDLIDRDALKKAWLEECGGDCATCGYLITEKRKDLLTDWIGCELIENAPKIETFTFDDMNRAQEVGYKAGKLEGKSEIPHGKWITIDAFVVKCSVCGVESFATPFCPRCGADMREGDNET